MLIHRIACLALLAFTILMVDIAVPTARAHVHPDGAVTANVSPFGKAVKVDPNGQAMPVMWERHAARRDRIRRRNRLQRRKRQLRSLQSRPRSSRRRRGRVRPRSPARTLYRANKRIYECVGWEAGRYISIRKYGRAGDPGQCPGGFWLRWLR